MNKRKVHIPWALKISTSCSNASLPLDKRLSIEALRTAAAITVGFGGTKSCHGFGSMWLEVTNTREVFPQDIFAAAQEQPPGWEACS
jgi:hypothetical protein